MSPTLTATPTSGPRSLLAVFSSLGMVVAGGVVVVVVVVVGVVVVVVVVVVGVVVVVVVGVVVVVVRMWQFLCFPGHSRHPRG